MAPLQWTQLLQKSGLVKEKHETFEDSWFGTEIIIRNKANYIYWSMSEHIKARNLKLGGLQQGFYGSGPFQHLCDISEELNIAWL